jgi:OOP family OmpA-OmpF porin
MKRNTLFITIWLAIGCSLGMAQEAESNEKPFNRWSVEVNVGQNKPVRPFSTGYYSADPTVYFNFSEINHFDLGARYMFSNSFGIKLDYAMDQFNEQSGAGSLPFDTQLNRIGIQGVMNLGRLLRFETFTNRFGLLTHAGIHVSQFKVNEGANKNLTEDNGGVMFGITPQIRLTKWLAFTADFTVINNVRQHLNWDGSAAISDNNLSGMMYNTSIGFTAYLGKKEKHADWYNEKDIQNNELDVDLDARKRLDDIETLMNDTDRDGVPDYLDAENNTPNGVAVDTKGRFIDANKNGTPDEMESRARKDTNFTEVINKQNEQDAIGYLIEKGYVNIFFDVNKDVPNSSSSNNVYYIVKFMRDYPEAKIALNGYADLRGNEKENLDLSERRVQTVYNLLIGSGIQGDRIQIKANGIDKTFTDTTLGYNLARRVSITIIN